MNDISEQKSAYPDDFRTYASVPFSIDLSFDTVQGVLNLGTDFLRIEWRVYDMLDAPKGDLQTKDIPVSALTHVAFKKGWIGSKLRLYVNSAKQLKDIPLPAGNITELSCRIKRRNANQAELLAADLSIRIAEG